MDLGMLVGLCPKMVGRSTTEFKRVGKANAMIVQRVAHLDTLPPQALEDRIPGSSQSFNRRRGS